MSSHPGSTLRDAIELSLFLKKEGLHPKQVQDFYPTPGCLAAPERGAPRPRNPSRADGRERPRAGENDKRRRAEWPPSA